MTRVVGRLAAYAALLAVVAVAAYALGVALQS
jgi:hypothetical protein